MLPFQKLLPVHKKKMSHTKKNNCQPIIILSNLFKIRETYADETNTDFDDISSKSKCGFQKSYSAQHCLLYLLYLWFDIILLTFTHAYLSHRLQETNVGSTFCELMSILFNGLQGSILGSLLFINCICDLFILNDHLEFGSYVDYTTASAFENNSEEILGELGKHMSNIFGWFLHNCLRANAKKFHHFFKVQSCKLKEALINDRLLALKVS